MKDKEDKVITLDDSQAMTLTCFMQMQILQWEKEIAVKREAIVNYEKSIQSIRSNRTFNNSGNKFST